jgi:hypothetical protein
MKSEARLQAFPAHLLAFTPGPLQYPPLLPRVRPSTLCLPSHSSRLNLRHLMATQNHQRTRPCRRLRRKLGLHPQQDHLVLRNRLLQPVGVKFNSSHAKTLICP